MNKGCGGIHFIVASAPVGQLDLLVGPTIWSCWSSVVGGVLGGESWQMWRWIRLVRSSLLSPSLFSIVSILLRRVVSRVWYLVSIP